MQFSLETLEGFFQTTHPLVAKCGSHKLEDGDDKQLIASECVTIAYGLEGIVKTFISVHFRYVTT